MNRVFIPNKIELGKIIDLTENKNYLSNVLRLAIHSEILLFNNVDGEYVAKITEIGKKHLFANIVTKKRDSHILPELNLYIASTKPDRMSDSIDMAVQLGITSITPVITEYTQYKNINYDKIEKRIIESTEQSGRLDKPKLYQAIKLQSLFDKKIKVIWANEKETMKSLRDFDINDYNNIIIGPEGGFSSNEVNNMQDNNNFASISLCKTILRAETAVACAISQIILLKNK